MKALISMLFLFIVFISSNDLLSGEERLVIDDVELMLVWGDDFSEKNINDSNWGYRYLGVRGDSLVSKQAINFKNGLLEVCKLFNGGNHLIGMIGSEGKREFRYGYYEAKVKLQKKQGHWSGFWLQSPSINNYLDGPEKAGVEIDIFEYNRIYKNKIYHTIHWGGYGDQHRFIKKESELPKINDWIVFGLLWDEDGYTYYVNREKVERIRDSVSSVDQYLIFSMESGAWAGSMSFEKDCFYVDYVRVYQKANYN